MRRFLLHGRSGEGCCGRAASCTARDRTDGEGSRIAARHQCLCLCLGSKAVIEFGHETLTRGKEEGGLKSIGRLGYEGDNLTFAVDDEANGYGLHAPS